MPTAATWLVPESQRVLSPHVYRPGRLCSPVEIVVVHWTGSPAKAYDTRQGTDEARVRRWLGGDGKESSTHFVILRDGTLLQGAVLEARTWHAGESVWPARPEMGSFLQAGGKTGHSVNRFSIGVDFENVGELTRADDGWRDYYKGAYAGPAPVERHEPYTRAQVDAFKRLALDLMRHLPILCDRARWLGHRDVSPGRKSDPGPLCPWHAVEDAVRETQAAAATRAREAQS